MLKNKAYFVKAAYKINHSREKFRTLKKENNKSHHKILFKDQ